jgi:hypothetical protein
MWEKALAKSDGNRTFIPKLKLTVCVSCYYWHHGKFNPNPLKPLDRSITHCENEAWPEARLDEKTSA